MLCCMNFQLPDNIRARLRRCCRIIQRTVLFKNAEYLTLQDCCNKDTTFFVQLINEPLHNVELRRLGMKMNILVVSRTLAAEKPDLVADQIMEHVTEWSTTPMPPTYPCGFTTELTGESLDVGNGVYPWPSRVFSPFVDITAWPTYQIADMSTVTGVKFYNLGFVVSQSPTDCTPSWGTYYPINQIPAIDQIKKLRDMGGDITVSFGGAANTPIHICAPDATSIKDIYMNVINLYNLRRIDFDIENPWVEYTDANERNAQALKMLQDELSFDIEIWLTLPISTEGLVQSGLTIVGQMKDAGVNITGVNGMTMDYGPPIEDMGQAAIDAITGLNTQLGGDAWDMIGATPMIGKNDQPGETFTLENALALLDFCKSKSVRMISMWSSNRDTSQGSGIPQEDNQFSKTFQPYTD
ncbi:chitinase [Clostridiaceae bacterium M8S5]|nr:chitinase [Clostridiaceae bacterium M8S5]